MILDPSAFVADPELIQALEEQSTPISCDEERVLFHQGDAPVGLFILKSGPVTLSMTTEAGVELISFPAREGSLLGLPGLIGDEPYSLSAIAHPGVELRYVTRDSFTSMMRMQPMLALKVLQVLAAEVRAARAAVIQRISTAGRKLVN
jgi:CRP-like cAMP-binding protein